LGKQGAARAYPGAISHTAPLFANIVHYTTVIEENIMKTLAFIAALGLLATAGEAKSPFGGLKPPGYVGGKGTTTPQYIEDIEKASPALQKLYRDDKQLLGDQYALYTETVNIHDFLQTSADRLAMLETLDSDLQKLDTALTAANDAATAAALIPAAREKANKVKDTLTPIKTKVTAARKRMDAIVARTTPLRQKLDTAADKMNTVSQAIYTVNEDVVANLPIPVAIAAGCVKKIPADKQACAQANLDDVATKLDVVVNEYDRVVRLLLVDPSGWMPSMKFMDPFSAELNGIEKIREDLEALLDSLRSITGALNGLAAVMDKEFSFSFPYPNPTWKNPVRVSHYSVSVSFKVIIQGADAIEREIENILSDFLWKILKELGVGKFVKGLQEDAERAVNSAMNKVHFDIKLDMPSFDPLDGFEKDLAALELAINGFKFPAIDASLPGFGFPGVATGIDFREIGLKVKFFSPTGLYSDDINVCNGVAYGCK